MATKPKVGRPPRPDNPEPTTLLLASAVRRRLKMQAAREGRAMGLIVEDGLRLYQAKAEAREKRAAGRERGKT